MEKELEDKIEQYVDWQYTIHEGEAPLLEEHVEWGYKLRDEEITRLKEELEILKTDKEFWHKIAKQLEEQVVLKVH